ncbi:MAG: potassium-transporting ATPase subunit F [Rhodocyclaceae bacterium]|jgi:K+-transporting ATPase KdpF subunit|nr:potassium-transporting ATPase subunit F [Rhodocyclaceae bacterium]
MMNPLYLIALAVAIGVFGYLVAVLFFPEDFS